MEIILFKQNNCNPCDTLSNILKYDLEVEADRTINMSTPQDDDIETAMKYEVMSTPVLVLVDDDGEVIREIRGLAMREDIKSLFEQRGLI